MKQEDRADYVARVLVWTWRKIAAGGSSCPLIAREFAQLFGEDSPEVLATLCTFLRAVALCSNRRMKVAYAGCLGRTSDERQVLALIAAAQAGNEARLEAHLRWFARSEARLVLRVSAHALGAALERTISYSLAVAAPILAIMECRPGPLPRLKVRLRMLLIIFANASDSH